MRRFRTHLPTLLAVVGTIVFSMKIATAQELEYNTDRPGSDYRNFEMSFRADPELCQQACEADHDCRAFTFVKAGVQGQRPRCWLKSSRPEPQASECCVSGVSRHGEHRDIDDGR